MKRETYPSYSKFAFAAYTAQKIPFIKSVWLQFTRMSELVITIEDNAPQEDVRLLWDGIGEYNFSQTGLKGEPIWVFLRNEQHQVIGGAYGWANFGWLNIRVLWLREDQRQRGWGTRLLQATEAEAMKKGCRHSHLETYSFQALGFYQKNGTGIRGTGECGGRSQVVFFEKRSMWSGRKSRLTSRLRPIAERRAG